MATKNGTSIVVRMILAKETKGALRYEEVDSEGKTVEFGVAKIGTLYIRKSAGLAAAAITVQVTGG